MKNYLSFKELDEIGESLIVNYLGAKSNAINSVDIEGFAKSLGLKIVSVCFAEADMSKAGFIADGINYLRIKVNGKVIEKKYPAKTIVIDNYLQKDGEENKKRFTLAHEIAHYIINQINHKQVAAFNTEFDREKVYSVNELKDMLNFNEIQADRLAAAMLMPKQLVIRTMKEKLNGKSIILYGDNIVDAKCKPLIKKLADSMGVSYQACYIRLKDLNLFEKRDITEYLEKNIGIGGLMQ